MTGFFHSALAWFASALPWLLSPAGLAAPASVAAPTKTAEAAASDFRASVPAQVPAGASATRYAGLSSSACRAELKKRKLAVTPAGGASGVALPLRFSGPFQGVKLFAPGKKSVYGVFDCRLALALDDLAGIAARHGVVEIHIDNLYRPHAHLPGQKNKPSQHSFGLAVDILSFKLDDGRELVVEKEWSGERGAAPCGPDAKLSQTSDAALLLRTMVCEVARQGLFHHLLTPSYDEAHRNHLHFDIKRGARELLLR